MVSPHISVRDQNCCLWIKHSEGCAQVKHAGAAIVAALGAIALVAGVLLILAQQGYQLAGINTISQMVETKWVYLGVGIAGALLVIDTTFIIAQVKSYLNQTIPQDELEQRHFFNDPSTHLIGDPLPSTACAQDVRDDIEESSEYLPADVEARMGSAPYQNLQLELTNDLSVGTYRMVSINLEDFDTWVVALRDERGLHVHCFKTQNARDKWVRVTLSNLMDIGALDRLGEEGYDCQVRVALQIKAYWTYEVETLEGKKFYFVAYGSQSGVQKKSFVSEESRTAFMLQLPADAADAKEHFHASERYTTEEAADLISAEKKTAWDQIDQAMDYAEMGHYTLKELPMKDRPELCIYALKIKGNSLESYFFKTNTQRQAFIEAKLQENNEQRSF